MEQRYGQHTQAQTTTGEMMRYFGLVFIWFALSFGPLLVGSFWDSHYFVYQALDSMLILLATCWLIPRQAEWRAWFVSLSFLQILHNLGAFISPAMDQNYNHILDFFNVMEAVVLLGWGGFAEWLHDRRSSPSRNSRCGHNSDNRIERTRSGAHV